MERLASAAEGDAGLRPGRAPRKDPRAPPGRVGARSLGKRACAQRLRDKHQFAEPGNRALPNPPKPKQSRCKGIEA